MSERLLLCTAHGSARITVLSACVHHHYNTEARALDTSPRQTLLTVFTVLSTRSLAFAPFD